MIYNGVPSSDARPRERRTIDRIGVIGRIAPEKGQREFVHPLGLLLPLCPDVSFGSLALLYFPAPDMSALFERKPPAYRLSSAAGRTKCRAYLKNSTYWLCPPPRKTPHRE